MNTHWHLPWTADDRTAGPGPLAALLHDPETMVVDLFELTAIGYLLATLGVVALIGVGILTAEDLAGHGDLDLGSGFLAVALSGLAGILYGLPAARGGRLWSPKMAAVHYVLMNLAALVPIGLVMSETVTTDGGNNYLLAGAAAVQVTGIVLMLINLLQSAWNGRP